MKFMVGDYVRHVNGLKEFLVINRDSKQGVYALKEDGSNWIHYFAACHVEAMYRQMCWNEPPTLQPVNQPEVVTEYEYQGLGTRFYFWSSTTPSSRNGSHSIRNTGRTRKVVVQ